MARGRGSSVPLLHQALGDVGVEPAVVAVVVVAVRLSSGLPRPAGRRGPAAEGLAGSCAPVAVAVARRFAPGRKACWQSAVW